MFISCPMSEGIQVRLMVEVKQKGESNYLELLPKTAVRTKPTTSIVRKEGEVLDIETLMPKKKPYVKKKKMF